LSSWIEQRVCGALECYANVIDSTLLLQYHVIRNKGTEPPGTGEYNKGDFKGGHFECRACGTKLYEYVFSLVLCINLRDMYLETRQKYLIMMMM